MVGRSDETSRRIKSQEGVNAMSSQAERARTIEISNPVAATSAFLQGTSWSRHVEVET